MNDNLLISIISVNLNDLEGLKRTFNSVFNQSWQEFEFVVIDGSSTDGSKELIEKQGDKIDRWISEPDNGVYHAMNKGIRMASGKYLLFLNSGDSICNENVLFNVSEVLKSELDIYYGDVFLEGSAQEKELLTFPDELSFSFFCNSTITHQAVFIKSSLFEELSFYNENFKLVSDWEFLICALCKYNVSYFHMNFPVVNYNIEGMSGAKNEKLLYAEREMVLNTQFPLFMKDYTELIKVRQILESERFQAFKETETKPLARKINSLLFKLYSNF